MSVTSLYDAFVRAAAAGTIGADILPLMGKLVAPLGVDALPLTQGNAERLSDSARLTGNTTWANGTAWALIMIGTVEAGRDVLSLSLTASTTRGFVALKTLVPDLPQSRLPSVDAPGTVTLGDSVLADLGPEQAVVTAAAVDAADTPA